jgi:hypothetical protein
MGPSLPPAVQTDPFTHLAHAKQRAFLTALAEMGRHTRACHVVGIAHSHPWYWRRTDPTFAVLERHAWELWIRKVVAAARTPLQRWASAKTSPPDRDRATPHL